MPKKGEVFYFNTRNTTYRLEVAGCTKEELPELGDGPGEES